jgi:hypothetical protein
VTVRDDPGPSRRRIGFASPPVIGSDEELEAWAVALVEGS